MCASMEFRLAEPPTLILTAREYRLDDRQDYGENRIRAISFLGGALYVLVFVGDGDSVRAISLRNATKQEYREYAEVR